MILDEYFASIEFLSSGEAGVEYGLSSSASNASIPLNHKLDSTSSLVDSGVDLNVRSQYSGMANQSSIDVDDVFTDDSGMFVHLQLFDIFIFLSMIYRFLMNFSKI